MTQPEKGATPMEPMLSVKQAATALGISVSTLYRMVDEGTLRKLKVRNRTVFERAEIERYIQAQRAEAAAAPRATGIGADGTPKRAVVLLSGGLDSATALAIAKDQGFSCYAISFRYGQRHVIELEAARAVGEAMGVKAHVEAEIDLRLFGGSALTADIEVPKHDSADDLDDGVPITYVPARNTVFLSFALAWAETLKADDLFIGVNALDFSGYPDCRPDYIHAYQAMANLATVRGVEGYRLHIHTPLINLTKGETIRRGVDLGVDYGLTRSCYDPSSAGDSCGHCDSCLLRLRGFEENGLTDPAPYLAQSAAA